MVFYGYSVMKNPRVWGDQGRQAVKAENFAEYCRQNGLFFLKAGCIMAVIAALDALFTLDAVLYVLLYLFGLAFSSPRWSSGAARTRASRGRGPMWKARKSGSRSCEKNKKTRRSELLVKSTAHDVKTIAVRCFCVCTEKFRLLTEVSTASIMKEETTFVHTG